MSNSTLSALRAAAGAACFGPAAGKSRTLQFLLSADPKADPIYAANALPLVFWGRAIVEGWASRATVASTFWQAQEVFNGQVRGPCSAVLATLARLGWTAESFDRWLTGCGVVVDLSEVHPGTLRKLVDIGTERALLEGLSGSDGLELLAGAPLLDPIRKAQAQLRREGHKAGAQLLATHAAGGLWTQQRLFEARSVTSPLCVVCQAAPGTPRHRLFCCDFSKSVRDGLDLDDVTREGSQCQVNDPLLFRCLADSLLRLQPPPSQLGVIHNDGPLQGGALSGLVGIDGSCFDPEFSHASRAGWACVAVDSHGDSRGAVFGTLPTALQEIGLAEVWAMYMCLQHSIGALVIITDCKAVADGLLAGPEVCCRATRPYSEIWVRVWDKIQDIGRDHIQVIWVPSHTSWREAQARGVEWLHFRANKLADTFAKRGARGHPTSPEVVEQRPLLWWAARFVAYYTGRVLSHLAAAGLPDVERPRLRRGFDPLELVSDPRGHQVKFKAGRWGCLQCGRSCATRSRLCRLPCPGVPPRLAQAHHSHRLWWAGGWEDGVLWCSACGGSARRQILSLRDRCPEHPTSGKKNALKLLKRGIDPSTQRPLPARSTPVSPPLDFRRDSWVQGLYDVMAENRDTRWEE